MLLYLRYYYQDYLLLDHKVEMASCERKHGRYKQEERMPSGLVTKGTPQGFGLMRYCPF